MSKSPEAYKVPKIAMATIALFSLAIKSEVKLPISPASNHELQVSLDALQINYPSKPIVTIIHEQIAKPKQVTETVYHPNWAAIAAESVTPKEYAEWSRVNICEEAGNWQADGPKFSGGLGISVANWNNFGGTLYAPRGAEATPDEQIVVAERIEPQPPDQTPPCKAW